MSDKIVTVTIVEHEVGRRRVWHCGIDGDIKSSAFLRDIAYFTIAGAKAAIDDIAHSLKKES